MSVCFFLALLVHALSGIESSFLYTERFEGGGGGVALHGIRVALFLSGGVLVWRDNSSRLLKARCIIMFGFRWKDV